MFTGDQWSRVQSRLALSNREVDVVQQLVDGDTEARAAFLLGIGHSTVHTHVRRIYRKLNVCNQRDLLVRIVAELMLGDREGGNGEADT